MATNTKAKARRTSTTPPSDAPPQVASEGPFWPVATLPLPVPPTIGRPNGVIRIDRILNNLTWLFITVGRRKVIISEPLPNIWFLMEDITAWLLSKGIDQFLPARYGQLLRTSPLAFIIAMIEDQELTFDRIFDWLLHVVPPHFTSFKQRYDVTKAIGQVATILAGVLLGLKMRQDRGPRRNRVTYSRPL